MMGGVDKWRGSHLVSWEVVSRSFDLGCLGIIM